MARAGLGLGIREVATRANVSTNTITRLERGETLYPRTVEAIRTALEAAGVEFTNGDAPGVRLRPRPWEVEVYATGQEAAPTGHRTFELFAQALSWLVEQKQMAAIVHIMGPRSASDEECQAIRDAGGEPTFR